MPEYRWKILEKKDIAENEYRWKVKRESFWWEDIASESTYSWESNEYRWKVLDRKKRPLEKWLEWWNETEKPKKDWEDWEKKWKDFICKVWEVCDNFFKKPDQSSFRASVLPPKNNDWS